MNYKIMNNTLDWLTIKYFNVHNFYKSVPRSVYSDFVYLLYPEKSLTRQKSIQRQILRLRKKI